MRRTRAFALLKTEARNQKCRPTSRGDYAEWKQILGWYLQSHFSSIDDRIGHMEIMAYARDVALHRDSWRFGGRREPLSPQAARFANWTRQYFAPQLDQDYIQLCTAAQNWSHRSVKIAAKVIQPTQHERLEALLQLRDWLRDKAMPSEIEALLRAE